MGHRSCLVGWVEKHHRHHSLIKRRLPVVHRRLMCKRMVAGRIVQALHGRPRSVTDRPPDAGLHLRERAGWQSQSPRESLRLQSLRGGATSTSRRYPLEIRERARRLVFEREQNYSSQRSAIRLHRRELGMTAETLWLRQAERDGCWHPGLLTEERDRLRHLELIYNKVPCRGLADVEFVASQ